MRGACFARWSLVGKLRIGTADMNRRLFLRVAGVSGVAGGVSFSASQPSIMVPEACHPAVKSAAAILAKKLGIPESNIRPAKNPEVPGTGEIALAVAPAAPAHARMLGGKAPAIKHDGFAVARQGDGTLIYGNRPRSLLYAAGDYGFWKDKTTGAALREPAFPIRTSGYDASHGVAEQVAELGTNAVIRQTNAPVSLKESFPEIHELLPSDVQARLEREKASRTEQNERFARECADADIDYYAFLYGNDFARWSAPLYAAVVKAYPSVEGKRGPSSFEKASLCPSDPMTWKIVGAYLKEFIEQSRPHGLYATFWDAYGINCQCERCVKSGLNKFPNQLYQCVKQYHETAAALGKKLVVRTWSSGVPHWLRDEYVHAPGYDHFGGSGRELWGRVIKELPAGITIQTKVYHSDCQPDARFSPLLGRAAPHTEIAEYQIAGQTTGRFYFPASTVDHTAWTMKKSRELVGANGGVNVFPGGTMQSDYSLLDDIANSINVYAWRRLSWDVNADVDKIWMEWATPIYGTEAAPHIIKALKLSEEAVNRTFSALGMGSSTNSDFAPTIARRETLLMYTNRHYLPEYAKNLELTKENIQRVVEEKAQCLKNIEAMFRELELARPFLGKEQAAELETRFDWLREFAIVSRHLDESLWRFRYLRHLAAVLTTDPGQMKYLAEAYDAVRQSAAADSRLFRYDAGLKFSCYRTTLGNLGRRPELGDPLPLMKELYGKSREYVEAIAGPDILPSEWRR
jgi:hypothetical protein